MRFPDNHLAVDERVLIHRHPHWSRLLPALLVLVVVTAAASFTAAVVSRTDWSPTARRAMFGVIAAAWVLALAGAVIRPFLAWLTTHFVVTDRRVMSRRGVMTRSSVEMPLARIDDLRVRRGIIDRVLRMGTLTIASASQDPLTFEDIPKVERMHRLLYQEVFDTLRGGEFENRSRAWGRSSPY